MILWLKFQFKEAAILALCDVLVSMGCLLEDFLQTFYAQDVHQEPWMGSCVFVKGF